MKPVVLVTGAAGGIGQAVVDLMAERGWTVVGVDRPGAAPKRCARVEGCDVGDPDAVEALFGRIDGAGMRVKALVHNAAMQIARGLGETSPAEWRRTMDVNAGAAFWMTRAFLPHLEATRGAVVHVASVHARATSRGIGAYAASKGALVALTRAWALELAPRGIRVNAVLPGAVDTAMLRAGLGRGHVSGDEEEALRELGSRHPLGRVGRPDEIARMIHVLLDDETSSFVTGELVAVDGGALARLSTE